MSQIIFCTVDLPVARFIHWFTSGYAHAALVLDNGNWLDARFSGVRERPPEKSLYESEIVELPFDIEPAFRKHVGQGYNFKGVVAQWFHFYRWRSPERLFCDQAILAACRESGFPVVDEDREDKIPPQGSCDILKAFMRGLNHGTPTRNQGDNT